MGCRSGPHSEEAKIQYSQGNVVTRWWRDGWLWQVNYIKPQLKKCASHQAVLDNILGSIAGVHKKVIGPMQHSESKPLGHSCHSLLVMFWLAA